MSIIGCVCHDEIYSAVSRHVYISPEHSPKSFFMNSRNITIPFFSNLSCKTKRRSIQNCNLWWLMGRTKILSRQMKRLRNYWLICIFKIDCIPFKNISLLCARLPLLRWGVAIYTYYRRLWYFNGWGGLYRVIPVWHRISV